MTPNTAKIAKIANTESVATILGREIDETIARWMQRVEEIPALMAIPLSHDQRTGHLPRLIDDLIVRLRQDEDSKRIATTAAHDHGQVRFKQGYSVPMLVEESRLLQVSIFDTLRRSQQLLDATHMMTGVVIIADECDAQLKDTVETFMELQKCDPSPQGRPPLRLV